MPVFIVGMPRSGTTLLEQILASHPDVHGAGELPHIQRIADAAGPIAALDADRLAAMGRDYLIHPERLAAGRRHVIDKMPSNFLHVGLIRLILPDARIIHCRRDPVDTCLSCYTKLFTTEQSFTYELNELGRFHRGYAAGGNISTALAVGGGGVSGVTVGGNAGGASAYGGNGAAVSVCSNYSASCEGSGGITTYGQSAPAIFAQSIGGAGGNGGASQSNAAGTAYGVSGSVGGFGSEGGAGGAVSVSAGGSLATSGLLSPAIQAQSVGGGGGNGGSSAAYAGSSGTGELSGGLAALVGLGQATGISVVSASAASNVQYIASALPDWKSVRPQPLMSRVSPVKT